MDIWGILQYGLAATMLTLFSALIVAGIVGNRRRFGARTQSRRHNERKDRRRAPRRLQR
jgi:hypothetical protein